jgi:hypothetical protein
MKANSGAAVVLAVVAMLALGAGTAPAAVRTVRIRVTGMT